MSRTQASIYVLMGASSYGVVSTITKLAYQHGFVTGEITGSQVFFGCLFLWLVALPACAKTKRLSRKSLLSLIMCGMVSGLTGIFYYLSLKTLSASFAIILMFQFTWIGLLLEWMRTRVRPRWNHWLATAIILSGSLLASASQLNGASLHAKGIFFGLLSALTYALFIYFSNFVATDVNPMIRSASFVTGGLFTNLLIFSPAFLIEGKLFDGLWFWGLLLGLFGSVIPTILFMKGIPHIGSGLASILGSVELPAVIVVAALFLHEQPTMLQWAGVLLILLGILISEVPSIIGRRSVSANQS
ncbi:EamA family transporter [Laceyella tengchongensis]|uniref:EamA family transporter n=1 Tax=Laceyella tengchongensis TaxID=574699 RepID=UPI0012B8D190|nr:EamA family transporter [Laceyella tengchongensis]